MKGNRRRKEKFLFSFCMCVVDGDDEEDVISVNNGQTNNVIIFIKFLSLFILLLENLYKINFFLFIIGTRFGVVHFPLQIAYTTTITTLTKKKVLFYRFRSSCG